MGSNVLIKEVTTVGFDPVKEYEAMKNFEAENDMRDWVKEESTVMVAYIRTKTIWAGGKE